MAARRSVFARDEYGAVPKAKHAQSAVGPTAQQTADDFSLGGGNSASNEVLPEWHSELSGQRP